MQDDTSSENAVVYFGFPPGNRGVSESLTTMGINLLKATPSEIKVTSMVSLEQPAYKFYVSHLPYYLAATVNQENVLLTASDILFKRRPTVDLPIPLPNIVVIFGALTQDQEAKLKEHQHTRTVNKNKNLWTFLDPSREVLDLIVRFGGDLKTPHLLETANPLAAKKFISCRGLIAAVISVQSYPAFHDAEHLQNLLDEREEKREEEEAAQDDVVEESTNKKRKTRHTIERNSGGSSSTQAKPQRRRIARPQTISDTYENLEEFSNNTFDGMWLPYVDELAKNDSEMVPHFIENYCLRNIATSVGARSTKMSEIRSAWGILGSTRSGRELSHLTKCVSLALHCQSRPLPLFDQGAYAGTVLLGSGFQIAITSVHRPIASADLNQLVIRHSPRQAAFINLNELEMGDYSTARSIADIHTISVERKLTESQYTILRNRAFGLRFRSRHWPVTLNTLKDAFRYLENPDEDISSLPITASAIGRSREERIFSSFGSKAPTFNVRGGTWIKLDLSKPPKTLSVSMVSYTQAALDFNRIKQERRVMNDLRTVSGAHILKSFNRDNKTELWRCICGLTELDTPTTAQLNPGPIIEATTSGDTAEWFD